MLMSSFVAQFSGYRRSQPVSQENARRNDHLDSSARADAYDTTRNLRAVSAVYRPAAAHSSRAGRRAVLVRIVIGDIAP